MRPTQIAALLLLLANYGVCQLFNVDDAALAGILGPGIEIDDGEGIEIDDGPELPSPPDEELNDIFWPEFDPTSDPVEVYEDFEPGDTVTEIRARHPNRVRLEIRCYNEDSFLCISQDLGNGDWQFQVLAAEIMDREATPYILFPFEIWVFDTDPTTGLDAVFPYKDKNFTAVFRILDVNDNPPVFSKEAHEITLPTGLVEGSVHESGLFVSDFDEGVNAEINLVCDPDQSLEQACEAFDVALQLADSGDPKVTSYSVLLFVKPLAAQAPNLKQFALALVADDNPEQSVERLSNKAMLLVNIEGPEDATPGPPGFTTQEFCPCVNGACMPALEGVVQKTFTFSGADHYCLCIPGYYGNLCQNDACKDLCLNGGQCVPDPLGINNPTCQCVSGFGGERCEDVVVTTESSDLATTPEICPCVNGDCVPATVGDGQKTFVFNGFDHFCLCIPGFFGNLCQNDACKDLCFNWGQCIPDPQGVNTPTCQCQEGFTGAQCEFLIPEATTDFGVDVESTTTAATTDFGIDVESTTTPEVCPCVNGDCVPTGIDEVEVKKSFVFNGFDHYCFCIPGFDGNLCQNDACKDLCLNGAQCVPDPQGINSPTCQCLDAFVGDRCEFLLPPGTVQPETTVVIPEVTTAAVCPCINGDCVPATSDGHESFVFNGFDHFCLCIPGFVGSLCENDICKDWCLNGAQCIPDPQGLITPTCRCLGGFVGDRCEFLLPPGTIQPETTVDPVEATTPEVCPCVNGDCVPATDVETADLLKIFTFSGANHFCSCIPGYSGNLCQNDVCDGLCLNGGQCVPDPLGINNPKCECLDNFVGFRCEHLLPPATPTQQQTTFGPIEATTPEVCPCVNGDCVPATDVESADLLKIFTFSGANHFCSCIPGYYGNLCQNDACDSLCMNGGICVSDPQGINKPKCECPDDYVGFRCEYLLPPATTGPVTTPEVCPCVNGTCVPTSDIDFEVPYVFTLSGADHFCFCTPGFYGNFCENDACAGLCFNGGQCIPDPQGLATPSCRCQEGFVGSRCELLLSTGTTWQGTEVTTAANEVCPCINGDCMPATVGESQETFVFNGFDHYCMCIPGFFGNLCQDDACKDLCLNGGQCIPDPQGINWPTCQCLDGFVGDRCELPPVPPVTDMETSSTQQTTEGVCPCVNGNCVPATVGDGQKTFVFNGFDHYCMCIPGFYGNLCQNDACKDLCLNGGQCIPDTQGINNPTCQCLAGFFGDRCELPPLPPVTQEPTTTDLTTTPLREDFMEFEQTVYGKNAFEGITSEEFGVIDIGLQTREAEPKPSFSIVNDHLQWFELGPTSDMGIGWYRVPVFLREGSQLIRGQPGITEDGVYEFSVQASAEHLQVLTRVQVKIAPGTTTTPTTPQPTTTMTSTTTTEATTTISSYIEFVEDVYEKDAWEGINAEDFGVVTVGLIIDGVTSKPTFQITNDPMQWFELGQIEEIQDSIHMFVVPVFLRQDAQLSRNQFGVQDGIYQILIQATADQLQAVTTVSVNIAPVATPQPEPTTEQEETTLVVTTDAVVQTVGTIKPPERPPLPNDLDVTLTPAEIKYEMGGKQFEGVAENLGNGDFVPGLQFKVGAEQDLQQKVALALSINDGSDLANRAFEFYPKKVDIGRPFYLRVKDSSLLDYESQPDKFAFTIIAQVQDRETSFSKTPVIELPKLDVSDHAPEFLDFEVQFSVSENSLTGTAVGQIQAIDSDTADADKISYTLTGDGSKNFAIHNGALSVACPTAAPCLDREVRGQYDLLVVATDPAGLESEPLSVIVKIDDKNDNGPKVSVSLDEIQISKGQLKRPVLVMVKDADISPNNASIVRLDGSAASFFILERRGPTEYQLKLSAMPSAGSFELTVIAEDSLQEQKGTEISVPVLVMDAVSSASFKKPQYDLTVTSAKIVEGNPLIELTIQGNLGGPVQYRILNGNPGWLVINPVTGSVSVGPVPIDGVPGGKHHVTVSAIDQNTRKQVASTMLLLTVVGPRLGSVFPSPTYVVTADKNSPQVTVKLQPLETGLNMVILPDSIEAMDKVLKPTQFDTSLLAVSQEGEVILRQLPANHTVTLLRFLVAPEDAQSDTAMVTIYLQTKAEEVQQQIQEESKPVFAAPWSNENPEIQVTLVEGTQPGYVIAVLPAHDPRTGLAVTDLTLTGDFADFFDLNTNTGTISVSTAFDYEQLAENQRTFQLQLIAGQEPVRSDAFISVTVLDRDDNAPQIEAMDGSENFETTIDESIISGSILFVIKITDTDGMDDPFEFELMGVGAVNFQMKQQDDGTVVLKTVSELDYEAQSVYNLLLTVKDSGDNINTVPIKITISDQNDNAPTFMRPRYSAEVVENWPLGAVVIKLSATDADSGDNGKITYALTQMDDDSFSIDADTGAVRTVRPLLNKAKPEPYALKVTATDQGDPAMSSMVNLDIVVIEASSMTAHENNELQFISPSLHFTLELPENTPENKKIYTARAIYGDSLNPPSDLVYSLSGNGDEKWLRIESSTGDIYTAQMLDYEQQPEITVILWAQSLLQAEKRVSRILSIKILDQDDNLPQFDRDADSAANVFVVPPKMEKGYKVGEVKATDNDIMAYSDFSYYFLKECENELFELNAETGEILLTETVTDDIAGKYRLCIIASPQIGLASAVDIPYSARNISMAEITVEIERSLQIEQKEQDESNKAEAIAKNNTVVTIGSYMSGVKIPVSQSAPSNLPIEYVIDKVTIKKMNKEQTTVTKQEQLDLIIVDPESGEVRVSPNLAKYGQGIYTININANDLIKKATIAQLASFVHVVEDTNKLMYEFEMPLMTLKTKIDDYSKELQATLAQIEDNELVISAMAEPQEKFERKSSACFHAMKNGVLVNRTIAMNELKDLALENNALRQVYDKYSVVNIINCKEIEIAAASTTLATEWLWWIFGGLLAVLIFFTLCCYLCFVKRYKGYMIRKGQYRQVKIPVPRPTDTLPVYLEHPTKDYAWKETSMAFH